MMARLRLNDDTLAGILFATLGLLGWWLTRNLPMGSAQVMGPGYLPRVLCGCLVALGMAVACRGVMQVMPIAQWQLRPVGFVLGSVLLFALLLPVLGLFITSCLTVAIAAMAGRERRWKEILVLALGLAAGSLLIFVYALGLPMRRWPL